MGSNTIQIATIELKGQGGFLDLSTLKIAYRLVKTIARPLLSFWQVAPMPWYLESVFSARDPWLKTAAITGEFTISSQN